MKWSICSGDDATDREEEEKAHDKNYGMENEPSLNSTNLKKQTDDDGPNMNQIIRDGYIDISDSIPSSNLRILVPVSRFGLGMHVGAQS